MNIAHVALRLSLHIQSRGDLVTLRAVPHREDHHSLLQHTARLQEYRRQLADARRTEVDQKQVPKPLWSEIRRVAKTLTTKDGPSIEWTDWTKLAYEIPKSATEIDDVRGE